MPQAKPETDPTLCPPRLGEEGTSQTSNLELTAGTQAQAFCRPSLGCPAPAEASIQLAPLHAHRAAFCRLAIAECFALCS